VHVTLRVRDGVPSLRSGSLFPVLRLAIQRSSTGAFRVIHFSVQMNHLHLLVEADAALAFRSGMQGLAIRCALAINRSLGRRGPLWHQRYHAHALGTPREVRLALVYVLLNFRKHLRAAPGIDSRSSGPWFEGWARPPRPPVGPPTVEPARSWLARAGWRRAGGAIDVTEAPTRRLSSPTPRPRPSRRA
jgi:hypothetical protein